jgi:hypothetical protein
MQLMDKINHHTVLFDLTQKVVNEIKGLENN